MCTLTSATSATEKKKRKKKACVAHESGKASLHKAPSFVFIIHHSINYDPPLASRFGTTIVKHTIPEIVVARIIQTDRAPHCEYLLLPYKTPPYIPTSPLPYPCRTTKLHMCNAAVPYTTNHEPEKQKMKHRKTASKLLYISICTV